MLSDHADFMLMDFNEETLLHAGQKLVGSQARVFPAHRDPHAADFGV